MYNLSRETTLIGKEMLARSPFEECTKQRIHIKPYQKLQIKACTTEKADLTSQWLAIF